MEYFRRTVLWAASFMIGLLLSVSIQYEGVEKAQSILSETNLNEVLAKRLDYFPKDKVPELAKHLIELCRIHRFDPVFLLSLIEVESRFRIDAVSHMGAIGLMQMRLATAQDVLRSIGYRLSGYEDTESRQLLRMKLTEKSLMNPFVNTMIGMSYLSWLRDHYRGKPAYYFLAAYNMGPGRVDELLSQKGSVIRPCSYYESIRNNISIMRMRLL